MKLVYNIDFEIAGAIFMMILYCYLVIQYSNQSEINRRFKKLVKYIFAAEVMDILTSVSISYGDVIPAIANVLINTVYFILVASMAYRFLRYVESYIYKEEINGKGALANRIIYAVYSGMIVLNIFGRHFFYFNSDGEYIHGKLYIIVYVAPLYFLLFSAGVLIRNRKVFMLKQKFSAGIFIILAAAGPILQLLWFPDVLLSLFTPSVAVLVILFSLETPDYQKLMKTLDELEKAKEDEERARVAAQEANQTKTEFLANMSHELRTPINAILGYDELIMKETKESHTAMYAVNAQAAGRTLLSVVNDIIDFTGMDDKSLKLESAPYSVLSLIQDMMVYTEYNAEKKNLELELTVDENMPQELNGDVARILQILNNLSSNAVKYTKEGFVKIKIAWEQKEENSGVMAVEFVDSGIGMTPKEVSEISTSFSRFNNKETRNIQGIGLGLSIVTKLLDLMGSKLEIESEYGKGSRFSFKIEQGIVDASPIGKVNMENAYDRLWQEKISDKFVAGDAKILAVDDNVMNLDLFRGVLKETKIQIDTALNGEEALKLIEKNSYHIIFLDHMMPVMDGIETLQEIKRRNLCQGVPVIALTANAVTGAKTTYMEAGFDDYLSKPITGKQLESIVRKYLPKELLKDTFKETEINAKSQTDTDKDIPSGVAEAVSAGQTGEVSFLEKLSFLDTDTGMAYCCDSEEFYKEMLESYLSNEKYADILDFYEKRDWENYRIQVHALKSTSLSIGAVELSEQAKGLEMAAKEDNISYIEEHHANVMEQYKVLLSEIKSVIREPEQKEDEEPEVEQEEAAHILVVDDDSMNLRIAEKMLGGQYRVSSAKSGLEAFGFLEKETPNLILLDLHMPEMDGFEVIKQLKKDDLLKEIPVIFLTADDDRDVEVKGFKEGALDFIKKPFIADIMIQRVQRILELDRLQKHLQQEVEKQTRKAESRRKKVERLSLQVVLTLAKTIDAKDKYTNGHSERVAEYSREIARRAGMTEKEQEDIYYMGLLHDIGKIGIPDMIINKDGKLTDEEYGMIKNHPVIGADILKNISEIPGIDLGAKYHHEKYDGTGYPEGIGGEDIPFCARIIGVADAYDAMASKRSYRDVLPQEVVRAEIEKGAGTQFDPACVEIMLNMIDEDKDYHMREE